MTPDNTDLKKDFFEQSVNNAKLIEANGGDLPIEPISIGKILINQDKTILIEFRQLAIKSVNEGGAWYDVPFNGLGHLLCRNCTFTVQQTEIPVTAFFFHKGDDVPSEILINCNLQGLKIKLEMIELLDFEQIKTGIREFQDILIDQQAGRLFSIQNG